MKSIEQVINENPELGPTGWLCAEHAKTPRYTGASVDSRLRDEVDRATRFIQDHAIPRATSNRRQGSYGLKHVAERATGRYISNGAFILAALRLGYAARRFPNSPNCAFNMTISGVYA
jgi:hypothetical protein